MQQGHADHDAQVVLSVLRVVYNIHNRSIVILRAGDANVVPEVAGGAEGFARADRQLFEVSRLDDAVVADAVNLAKGDRPYGARETGGVGIF